MPESRAEPETTLPTKVLKTVAARLHSVNAQLARRYPGEAGSRQPVHTVYGGAHLFSADTAQKLGRVALRAFEEYAPDSEELASAVGLTDVQLAAHLHGRVFEKLRSEPVEDFRIDFEDGYGVRPDAEEDGHAASVAAEVARGMREGTLPAFIGIRIKPLTEELHARSLRTLDVFMTELVRGARPARRGALRHVRLHGGAQHHGRAPAHASPGVRFRATRDAGRVRRHGRVALRRVDHGHAGAGAPRVRGRRRPL